MNADHDDLIRLQQQVITLQREIDSLKRFKTDTEALIHRGRGAWWMLLKVGIALSSAGAAIYWLWKAIKAGL